MLYANTDDGSSALWVLDGDGVVIDNISIYGAERAPILAQINEHYGTSFTGWSDNEIGLRFGGSLPNWNAYEKIEMQIARFKAVIQGTSNFSTAYIDGEGDILKINGNSQSKPIICSSDGIIISYADDPGTIYSEVWLDWAYKEHGIMDYDISNVSQDVGTKLQNWESYIEI